MTPETLTIQIEIDPNAITIGDIPIILRMQSTITDDMLVEMIEFGERIVIGGVKRYPLTQMQSVFAQIGRQVSQAINPKAQAGEAVT